MTQAFDPQQFRATLGQFATGIAVVTAVGADGRPAGVTVNSFASVSLDPPLVLWCLAHKAATMPIFQAAGHFAVNILAADQVEFSNRFALPQADRFAGVDWTPGLGGAPLLDGCCARLECRAETRHEAGDHVIFVGRVERLAREERPPLIYHASRYGALAELPAAPKVAQTPM